MLFHLHKVNNWCRLLTRWRKDSITLTRRGKFVRDSLLLIRAFDLQFSTIQRNTPMKLTDNQLNIALTVLEYFLASLAVFGLLCAIFA